MGEGKSYAEIARALGLSRPSITRHRNNLMRKLDVTEKAELLLAAVRVRSQLNDAIPTGLPGNRVSG